MVVAGLIIAAPLLCAASQQPDAEKQIVTAIRIEINDYPDPEDEIARMVRDLLLFKEGDPFSVSHLEKSIQTLKATRRFDTIHVDSNESMKGVELYFKVTPYPLIKNIRFGHIAPIYERDILKAMTLFIGNPLIPSQFPKQKEAIARLYRKEGFIAPKVNIHPEIDPADGNGTLYIDLDKGPYYRLDQLVFSGKQSVPVLMLKQKMKSWRRSLNRGVAGRFIETKLKGDIKALTQYYRRNKYAEAQIKYKLDKDDDTHLVKVDINIAEGPLYQIAFTGNKAFSDRLLKKNLVFLTEGNIRNRGERKSVKNIKKRYQHAGFLATAIRVESDTTEENGQKIRTVTFNITEGPQTIVHRVKIKGNHALTTKALMANILTQPPKWGRNKGYFSPEKLANDVRAVQAQYAENGFLYADVQVTKQFSLNRERINVTFQIHEGPKTRVDQVTFDGLTAIDRTKALEAMALKPGVPFQESDLQSDKDVLKSLVAKKGYINAEIEAKHTLSADRTRAKITYNIVEGPQVRLGNIFYQGNFRTHQKVMAREWVLPPGEPLNPILLFKSQQNIRNLGIFNTVNYRRLTSTDKEEKIDILVVVEEHKPYLFEISSGYESDRGVFGTTKIADRNLFGLNCRGWVSGELSEIGYRFESGAHNPRLFGSQVAAHFHGFIEHLERFNQDFGTKKAGTALGFEVAPKKSIITGLDMTYEYVDQFRKESTTIVTDPETRQQYKPRNVLLLTPRFQLDTRDSFVSPRTGLFSTGSIDFSKGLKNDLDDFASYHLNLRYFWTPVNRLTIASVFQGDYLDPYNSSGQVPKDRLFYLGGITNIRGFKQNALLTNENGDAVGGQWSLYGSLEARIRLWKNWEIPLFMDAGYLGGIQAPGIDSDLRITTGTGLRYITPIGPIGILYGHKLDRKPGESAGSFHFSLGYTF